MKKFFLMAGFALLAASCSNEESLDSSVNPSNDQVLAPVTVQVADFSIAQEDFPTTRSTQSAESYQYVKALTLAFYRVSDGHEMVKITHFRSNPSAYTDFDEFSTELPLGSYTMVVLGYGQGNSDKEITLTSPTLASYGEGTVFETFAYTQPVTIANNTAVELQATLERVVTALGVQSTDNRPEGVTHIRLTCSAGGKSFSPTTGFATSNTGIVNLMGFSGTPNQTTYMGCYFFLAENEQTIDVTIETLDAADGNVLFSKTVTNVPMKRNRLTKLTGAMYNVSTSTTTEPIQVSVSWLDEYAMNF